MKSYSPFIIMCAFCLPAFMYGIQCGSQEKKPLTVSVKVRPDSAWREYETMTMDQLPDYQPQQDPAYRDSNKGIVNNR